MQNYKKISNLNIDDFKINKIVDEFEKINIHGNKSVSSIRLEMQHIMQNYCPVYRSEKDD